MDPKHLQLGQAGEERVEAFLQAKGLVILERNFRKTFGEIDLIAQDRDTLVFVEVRTRSVPDEVHPLETITSFKKQRIIKTAMAYLKEKGQYDHLCRFDVVAMTPGKDEAWDIEHIENAFEVSRFS